MTQEILSRVFEFFEKPLGVKMPPFFDFAHFDAMANILNQFPLAYVNCINSVGNGLYIDVETETVVIKPKDGFGGLGGEYVKPTALANVGPFTLVSAPQSRSLELAGSRQGRMHLNTCYAAPLCYKLVQSYTKRVSLSLNA